MPIGDTSSAAATSAADLWSSAASGRNDVAMEFRVRSGTGEDWSAYRGIRLRMLAESPDAYGSSYAFEARFPEERWRERSNNPLLYLAYAPDGRLVGTATGLPAADRSVDIVAMYVDPDYRGQGCAERLLDAVAAGARDREARRLVMHITDGNEAANRCFTRYGFGPTGRRWPMARNPGLTEVELAFDLRPGADG
jgi:ribosomal protein S18 acetylase RimI-like enzyme